MHFMLTRCNNSTLFCFVFFFETCLKYWHVQQRKCPEILFIYFILLLFSRQYRPLWLIQLKKISQKLMVLVLGKSQSWKHVLSDQVYFKIISTSYIWTVCTHQSDSFLAKRWKLMRKNIGDASAKYFLILVGKCFRF